jgi:competence protein ComEC
VLFKFLENNKTFKTQGSIIGYLEKNEHAQALKYGDILIAKCTLQEIEASKNPFQYSFKNYQALQDVYHSTYISSKNWKLDATHDKKYLKNLIINVQRNFNKILEKYIPDDEALGIALALLLGNKDELGTDTIQAYSKSGAMHVLAVSGLHVGIVYLVFNQLLFFFEKPKLKKMENYYPYYFNMDVCIFNWSFSLCFKGCHHVFTDCHWEKLAATCKYL